MSDYLELMDALQSAGLKVERLQFNKVVRCGTIDKPQSKNGWYIAHDTPFMMAVYGNWATDFKDQHIAKSRMLSKAEYALIHLRIREAEAKRKQALKAEYRDNASRLQTTLDQCQSMAGTPVEQYLINRGLTIGHNQDLLYCPSLEYWNDGQVTKHPAMIAKVTSPAGELVTLHRTYLTHDGKKAPVSTVKKLMRTAGAMKGASIKLGEPIEHPEGGLMLGIAEGIETALAASELYGLPVWAGVSTYGVKEFIPPAEVKHMYFFADHDTNGQGQKAAMEGAKRLARMGIIAGVITPESIGDWNDELVAMRAKV